MIFEEEEKELLKPLSRKCDHSKSFEGRSKVQIHQFSLLNGVLDFDSLKF